VGLAMTVLETVADRQAKWSATADALKADHRSGAPVGVCAVRSWAPWPQRWRVRWCPVRTVNRPAAIPAPGSRSSASYAWRRRHFSVQRLLGGEHVAAWVTRAGDIEGLKREAYKFAAEAAPYDGTDRGQGRRTAG